MNMTIDESNQIEALFDEWYAWQAGYVPSLGYGRVDPSCRGFSESERALTADERAEEADRKAAKRRAEQVDLCIDALSWQERAAIQRHMKAKTVAAMNRACAASVWHDARAYGQPDIHELYQQAKRSICMTLRRRGMLSGAEKSERYRVEEHGKQI
ncbi:MULTISPECIES: hypothetical protein [unclassified Burkholderia]|uniref:hypothetical protein n=1 Tax=unclassified Burkholderia TaxID=2613784 RepID=UPI001E63B095|nr:MULTISPECIES: hypothetical protein [unclassified Burkholderia]UEP31281.1 hypothetical protein LMA01_18865 [Burkholderia sp. B21-007]UEP43451.1 hypothetical protein LMA02_25675 [Burkholderia sp. B21-005]